MAMKVRYTVVNGEVIAERRDGVRKTYVPDPLGSTVALLDSSQNITDTFTYWPYGEKRSRTGTTPTPFRFVGTLGYFRDSATRTYVRAREYQQNYARWMTVDPAPPEIGRPFDYANLAPTTRVDPMGLFSLVWNDCTDFERTHIEAAFKHICYSPPGLRPFWDCVRPHACKIGLLPGMEEGTLEECMKYWCEDGRERPLKISCCHAPEPCWMGVCRKACGFAIVGREIVVCPNAWDKGKCPPLFCTLLHELIHVCTQLGHPKGSAFDCLKDVDACSGKKID